MVAVVRAGETVAAAMEGVVVAMVEVERWWWRRRR